MRRRMAKSGGHAEVKPSPGERTLRTRMGFGFGFPGPQAFVLGSMWLWLKKMFQNGILAKWNPKACATLARES